MTIILRFYQYRSPIRSNVCLVFPETWQQINNKAGKSSAGLSLVTDRHPSPDEANNYAAEPVWPRSRSKVMPVMSKASYPMVNGQ